MGRSKKFEWTEEQVQELREELWAHEDVREMIWDEDTPWKLFELRLEPDHIALVHRYSCDDEGDYDPDSEQYYYMITWLYPSLRRGHVMVTEDDVQSWSDDGQSPWEGDDLDYTRTKKLMIDEGKPYVSADPDSPLEIQYTIDVDTDAQMELDSRKAEEDDDRRQTMMCAVCGSREGTMSISSFTLCSRHVAKLIFCDPSEPRNYDEPDIYNHSGESLVGNCDHCNEPLAQHWLENYPEQYRTNNFRGCPTPGYYLLPTGERFCRYCEWDSRDEILQKLGGKYGHRCETCGGKGYIRIGPRHRELCSNCDETGWIK